MCNIVLAEENFKWNFWEKEELTLLLVIGRIALFPRSQYQVEDRIQIYIINFWTQKIWIRAEELFFNCLGGCGVWKFQVLLTITFQHSACEYSGYGLFQQVF